MLALAYYDGGETEKAVDHLERLFQQELTSKVFTGFAFDELVRIYKREKKIDRLVNLCENAVSVQPDDVGLLAELGKAYLLSGDYSQACSIYEKLIELEDDNPAFYCDLGEALFAAERFEKSEDAFAKAGKMDADNADVYYFKMAVLFQNAGRHHDAVRMLKRCIALKGTNPLYYCALGDSFVFLGEFENVLASYERAAECDPERTGTYYNRLGNTFLQNGNFEQAVNAFIKAIKADPLKSYFLNLAATCRAMGFAQQAEEILRELETRR
jgi:tetratricopeptide (TPR) repeat protein